MTHLSGMPRSQVSWEDCSMERHPNNNTVVLKREDRVLVLIDGAHLGVSKADDDNVALDRARPIFNIMIQTHNAALATGRIDVSLEIKRALNL